MEDGVQITHQHQGYLYFVLDGLQLVEEGAKVHAVLQGLSGGTLYDGAVGQRIAEGYAHFNHGDPTALHRLDDISGGFECWTAGTEIERQELFVLVLLEQLIDLILHILIILLFYLLKKSFDFTHIFKCRFYFEARIEVDTDALRMPKRSYRLSVVWTYAPTQQKGCCPLVVVEDRPVELLSITSYGLSLRIKEEVVSNSFVGLSLKQIIGCGDVESLDDGEGLQVVDIVGRLLSVKLDEIEAVVMDVLVYIFETGVDKDTYASNIVG